MKSSLLILFLVLFSSYGLTQSLPSEKEIYDVMGQFLYRTDSSHIYLNKQPELRNLYEDSSAFLSDTTYFSTADFAYLRLQMKEMDDFRWKKARLNKVETISSSKVKWIFRDRNGWKRFHRKHPKSCLRSCSMPLFSVNKTYCILYIGTQCGGLNGRGSINIYKLENGKWMYVDSYGMWVS